MTIIIEKGVARSVREGKLRPRTIEPRGIVVHTTGAGPWTRWNKAPGKFKDPYEAAIYVYERISKYSGHYVICGDTGRITKLVDPMTVAWHVGSKGSWRYKLSSWAHKKGYGWWTTRFKGCKSPRDLLDGALWRFGSANALCIGIEVAPPREGPRAPWSDATWKSLRLLCSHLGKRYGIPVDRYHVFTHSDAHPLARTRKSGAPWDPAPSQWTIGRASIELAFDC
jgi:hypothetical protein